MAVAEVSWDVRNGSGSRQGDRAGDVGGQVRQTVADDRGEPVIQLSPPLIAGPDEFDEIARIIRVALLDAMDAMDR